MVHTSRNNDIRSKYLAKSFKKAEILIQTATVSQDPI